MDQAMMASLKTTTIRHARGSQTPTVIPRLTIWFSRRKTDPMLAMFEPKVYVLLQGAKRLTIGSRPVEHSAGTCSVFSIGGPFMAQVVEASSETPYLAIDLRFNAPAIASLLLELPEDRKADVPAISVTPATAEITEPIYRLVRLLDSPSDVPVLAPLIERELYYRLLQSPLGSTIREVMQVNTRLWKVRKAVEWISNNASASLDVKQIAGSVGMSVTSFHRHFKAVTDLSPLAFQKHIRLLEARRMLTSEETNVTSVAFAVGYASSSQFSREYTRMFGLSPMRDIVRDAAGSSDRRRSGATRSIIEAAA